LRDCQFERSRECEVGIAIIYTKFKQAIRVL